MYIRVCVFTGQLINADKAIYHSTRNYKNKCIARVSSLQLGVFATFPIMIHNLLINLRIEVESKWKLGSL